MKLITWTCVHFIVELVGGTLYDMAQYAPDGTTCMVQDVSRIGTVCMFAADSL